MENTEVWNTRSGSKACSIPHCQIGVTYRNNHGVIRRKSCSEECGQAFHKHAWWHGLYMACYFSFIFVEYVQRSGRTNKYQFSVFERIKSCISMSCIMAEHAALLFTKLTSTKTNCLFWNDTRNSCGFFVYTIFVGKDVTSSVHFLSIRGSS